MKCVILQPSYIPWRGYFHQIREADVFVFYDDVDFDTRGWRNRNRICGANGSFWLTVPILSKGLRSKGLNINQVEIDWSRNWSDRHRKSLSNSYGRAPFFDNYAELLESIYSRRDRLIVDLLTESTKAISQALGIDDTQFVRSSSLAVEGTRNGRLVEIVRTLGCDRYITGPSASHYLDEDLFREAGVRVDYFVYDYPSYPQLFNDYDPQVSVLDLLFMKGDEASSLIWNK